MNFLKTIKRGLVILIAPLLKTTTAFSENMPITPDAGAWDGANRGIRNLYASLAGLLEVTIGLMALFVGTRIVISIMKGERESLNRLVWWLVGLVFGFIAINVILKINSITIYHA